MLCEVLALGVCHRGLAAAGAGGAVWGCGEAVSLLGGTQAGRLQEALEVAVVGGVHTPGGGVGGCFCVGG